MAIPSNEDFLSAITLIDASDLGHMRATIKPEAFMSDDKRRVRMLIEDVVWANARRASRVAQEPAVIWLLDQPSIQNLWLWPKVNLSTLLVSRSPEQTVEMIEWWLRDLSELACYDGEEEESPYAERRRLRKFDHTLSWFLDTGFGSALRWIRRVLSAFHEYFHHNDAIDKILDDRRQLESRISMINDGASAMVKLLADPYFTRLYTDLTALRIVALDRPDRNMQDLSDMATEMVAFANALAVTQANVTANTYPVLRRDQTSPERLLVVRLTAANMGLWLRRRANVTLKLLDVEGVVNRLDARTVERISAASAKRSDLRGEYRRREIEGRDAPRHGVVANDVNESAVN
ncbi:hypothetical protein [Pandoraea sp. NPDC090278]|uniref:hypothetical protein n=1 Tax=Pandoraea sp. NPDC090278 TaxID=3364391 RepID=UPI00383A6AF4